MKRILIVEDQPTSRELLRTVLEKLGHQVQESKNGSEALNAIQGEKPDLILMDLQIPAPVALTASAMHGDREKALRAGFTGYMAKPVSLTDLRDEVNRLLGLQ
jgi:CheY-like chemotaxis protein